MHHPRRGNSRRWISVVVAIGGIAATATGSCTGRVAEEASPSAPVELRVGVAQFSENPLLGLRQLSQNLSVEGLLRPSEDGRLQPALADSWRVSGDGRTVSLHLKSGVKFHDGSALTAPAVVAILPDALESFMGPLFADVEGIRAADDATVEIALRKPAPFLLEALEAPIRKPGAQAIGTGPYEVVPDSTTEMRANKEYYLGRPQIDHITVSNYPTVRAAWADMLRDRLDMLYEVGTDALESISASTSIATFTYTRRYQYIIVLNSKSPALRAPETRRALNWAVDREAIVRQALKGHGVASSQPLAARHWALGGNARAFEQNPRRAAELFRGRGGREAGVLRFTCLVPPDATNERIALQLKQQLQHVGVDMKVEEAPQDQIVLRTTKGEYDAALIEFISGPTVLRPYLVWHSSSEARSNWTWFGNATIDAAFNRVRSAPSDDDYRIAVEALEQAFIDDPPAIFLAWSVRARAVSTRFLVPAGEPDRDVLSTLRLWKPSTGDLRASRN